MEPISPISNTQPVQQPTIQPARPSARRGLRGILIGLALLGTGLVGGLAGAAATTHGLAMLPSTSSPPLAQPAAPQPIAAQTVQGSSIAGDVFARVNPSVVQVIVSGQLPNGVMRAGSGSGFVVDADGLILTNNHVIDGARSVSVRFSTGATREARVLGTDRGNDLALLKVDLPDNVPVASLGDSDRVRIGDPAIAIGSPFGLDQTVTQGIISATSRTWAPGNGRVRRNLLQTDAPLNPGNSGGPLLNARGEVIGINSMIESPVRGSVGVGFAVPINVAQKLLPQLEAGARLEPVWLGISGQQLDAAIARDQGLTVQSGVLVTSVVPNSPAAQAGLRGGQGANERIPRGGDVITAIDGVPMKEVGQITDQLNGRKPGDAVELTIVRNGREQKVTVTLAAWPAETGNP